MKPAAYVYAILVDGEVRYIGKGRNDRMNDHVKMCRSIARRRAAGEAVKTTLLYNKLTKRWLEGSIIEAVVLYDGLTDEEAFAREAAEIATHKKGQLWNTDAGGLGRTSDSVRAQWADAETAALMRDRHREATSSASFSASQSRAGAEKWASAEYRQKTIAGMKATAAGEAEKARKAAAMAHVWAESDNTQRKAKMALAAQRREANALPARALALIAKQPGITRPALVEALGCENPRQLHGPLARLTRRGLIEKREGGFYRTDASAIAA